MTSILSLPRLRALSWECYWDREHALRLDQNLIQELRDCIQQWQMNCTREEQTWTQATYGLPSLIIRVEFFRKGDSIRIVEIEERPAGSALVSLANPQFRERLAYLLRV